MDELQICVLGPLEVYRNNRRVHLGGRHPRIALAALVVSLNHTVPIDGLVSAVWDHNPPPSGVDTLQSMLSRLRTSLGPHVIEHTDHSYRLTAPPETVDAVRFERTLTNAASLVADDPQTASSLARQALALWRGPPFGDVSDVVFLEPEAARLDALRLAAIEIRLEADVACGHLAPAIASLQEAVETNPYRERLWYQLILALARDGRRVEALRAVQQLRAILAETGLQPSTEILELEQQVLDEAPQVHAHLHH